MKSLSRFMPFTFFLFLLPMFLGCGGGAVFNANHTDPLIWVVITESDVTLGAGQTHQFTATVTGSSNTNVTWSLSGCTGAACGTISAKGLYTAPSVIPAHATITITAVAQADPTKVNYAAVELMPIAVLIAPADAWVPPGGTTGFTAAVRYDIHNAGVIWALDPTCSAACGVLSNVASNSVTYTAPASVPNPPTTTLTATSVADPSRVAEITITVATAGGMTEGDYAFFYNGWETPITNGYYDMYRLAAAGRFHADAQGNITDGLEDVNSYSGVSQSVPFTGTYGIGPNRRGSFTITTAQGTATYHMVLDPSQSRGEFIRYDALDPDAPVFGAGYFELQDKAAFSFAALAGPYAFGVFGTTHEWNRLAAVGRFNADASGALTNGHVDMSNQVHAGVDPQFSTTDVRLAGSFSAPSPTTGRGTATLTPGSSQDLTLGTSLNFAYYVISDQKILLVQIDSRNSTMPVLSGELRRQNGTFSAASFNAPAIFSMDGVNRANYGAYYVNAAIGLMVPDQSGSVSGIIDDNQGASNQAFTGSYTVDSGGRSALVLERAPGSTHTHVAYFFNPNEAFLLQTSGTDVLFGRLKPQISGPFTEASITEAFRTHTLAPTSEQAENDCGLTTFDGVGGASSTLDVNLFANLRHFDFNGTYTVTPNGRGTLTPSAPSSGSRVFWLVSPTELVGIGALGSSFWTSPLLEYEK
jgi:hypothetical protein